MKLVFEQDESDVLSTSWNQGMTTLLKLATCSVIGQGSQCLLLFLDQIGYISYVWLHNLDKLIVVAFVFLLNMTAELHFLSLLLGSIEVHLIVWIRLGCAISFLLWHVHYYLRYIADSEGSYKW